MADTSATNAFVEFERVQKSYDGENLVVKDGLPFTKDGTLAGPNLELLGEVLERTGKPVVASDNALQWAMLRAVGWRRPVRGWGRLLATVAESADTAGER